MQATLSLCVLLSGLYGGPELTSRQEPLVGIKGFEVIWKTSENTHLVV